jgi:LPXTG-motif cell wall-anchored protein
MLRYSMICLLASLPLLAQDRKPTPAPSRGGAEEKETEMSGDKGPDAVAPVPSNVVMPTRGQCHFVPATMPRRVAPGGDGTLVVVMVLEGDAVLVSPPPVTFELRDRQGPIQLGVPQFRPAKLATLATAFQGREAYDNTAIIDIPFRVDPSTPFGKHPVVLGLAFELHMGRSGHPIGRFSDVVKHDLEVGTPEPIPSVSSAAGGRTGVGQDSAPTPSTPTVTRAADASVGSDNPPSIEARMPEAPARTTVVPADPESAAADPELHSPAPPESSSIWFLVAGASLLVALVAMLFRRR